ncbi:MAG TPA: amino acid adenylation domain-containing protein [Candidatus Angelobacter sp.]|nr:amino acid adenylation domain-containing protein [Candidatus Angelobacter sp.]
MFESPTIAQLAGLIDQTTQSNGSNGASSHRPPAIKRAARKDALLPTSFAQQSLWLIDQLTPGKATYNMPSALRIRGELDVEVLKRTVEEVVRRHETLRTRFVSVRGEPQQIIEDHVNIEMPVLDLTHVSREQEREAEAMRLAREEAMQSFNLQQAPLFRGKLLRLDELNHVLLLTMHHIISDGWSTGVLIQEVSVLYSAFSAGRPSPLGELPIQYADYSMWQREWLEGGVLEQQLAYWRRQLAASSVLKLPADRPRPAAPSQKGALHDFVIEANVTQKLKRLAEEQGATLFMVLLAAFQTLLYRYSGQTDIAVGTPIAGRNNDDTEKLIGYFINTLVLRVTLSGSPSFRELVQRTKEVTLEAYAHQDVPFEKLVEALSPERNLDSTPLFQVMIVLQNVPQAELQLGGAKLQPLNIESDTAKFELTMVLAENAGTDEGTYGTLEYSTDLFEKATMGRMIRHFQTLLEAVASESGRAIDEFTLMQAAERRQLLVEWNDTAVSYGGSECIQELFEEQARKTPQATAVQYERQQLTYEDLNRRANQLAYHLRSLGVGPEVRVGICLQRSFEMVVGLLGVLKAGGTYVPLDPDHPQERLAYVLKDADVAVLLIHAETAQSLPATNVRIVHLNDDWKKIEAESCVDLPGWSSPENAAFIIYTSGSTGEPKGVVVPHRALCNQICWAVREFHISDADRFLQKTSLSFDVSAEEIFVPLTAGARVVLAKPSGERDLEYLARFVEDEAITCLDLPPALLQVLLDSSRLGPWTSVRLVLCGGEAVGAEVVRLFYDKFSIRLLNVYGPTETTVQSTFADQLQGKEIIPIGRPVANTQVYVLDERYAPVPVGVVGELLIGGSGLARGYGNRPELTAEKFVPNPFAKTQGERLYRTGDQVRWLADGTLEFLGRIDHQVKLRGYRIELGEIESALESHPNVAQSVVLAREDQSGSKRLIAYLIKRTGAESAKASELEEYLKVRVPEYMVPVAFVELEKWPLSHNGKIDRKSLPQPDVDTSEREYVTPRNPTEETLCRLWQEVLQRERVGIHDNFFKIGGHSLRAAQVAARMRESFKVEIPLRRMFESPTIAQLAQVIDQAVQTGGVNGAPSHLLPDIKRMARKAAVLPKEPIGRG